MMAMHLMRWERQNIALYTLSLPAPDFVISSICLKKIIFFLLTRWMARSRTSSC